MKTAILACTLLIAGCQSTATRTALAKPFELTFGRGAKWSPAPASSDASRGGGPEHEGYDPNLPGYRIVGDIASITLRPRTNRLPKRFVLVIQTSPGMPPMLENFTLAAPDITISAALPNGQELAEIRNPRAGKPSQTTEQVRKDAYFKFQVIGGQVHVTLMPKAMKLLASECRISWIDWYR